MDAETRWVWIREIGSVKEVRLDKEKWVWLREVDLDSGLGGLDKGKWVWIRGNGFV